MLSYAQFISRYPWALILVDLVLGAVLTPVAFVLYGFPDFSDPTKGFESRGTDISNWDHVLKLVSRQMHAAPYFFPITDGPDDDPQYDNDTITSPEPYTSAPKTCLDFPSFIGYDTQRFVIEANDGGNLMDAAHLRAICRLESTYVTPYWAGNNNCPFAFSLPFYVASFAGKTCLELTDEDVDNMERTIQGCYHDEYEYNPQCLAFGHVWSNVLQYLTDQEYFKNNTKGTRLSYTMLIFRKDWSKVRHEDTLDYYTDILQGNNLGNEYVKVTAANLGIYFDLFEHYILADMIYYGVAIAVVLILLVLYLRSFILMGTIIFNVVLTLGISYFLYFAVLRMVFFPFMNMLAGLLIIAIGADDVFILYDIWREYQESSSDKSIENLTDQMLKHGAKSIFVTSLTTSAALFANVIGNVVSIRCFGIFAGICVLVNFLLMITWVPGVIVLIEKASRKCCHNCNCNQFAASLAKYSKKFWGTIIPKIVITVWPLWLFLFTAMGVGGFVVVFATPKLSLPTSEDMVLFNPWNLLQKYDSKKEQFQFEIESKKDDEFQIPISIMWGVAGKDNGNWMDPDDNGTLEFTEFDSYSASAQEWHRTFCNSLKNQSFFGYPEVYICFHDQIKSMVEGPCEYTLGMVTLSVYPCCNTVFPLSKTTAEYCFENRNITKILSQFYLQKAVLGSYQYDADEKNKVFRYDFYTNQTWSQVFDKMDRIYKNVSQFMTQKIKSAPEGLKGGWFGGRFESFAFYDLHKSLAYGTYSGIGLSLAAGFMVLLLTSLDCLITLYALVTITFSITSTIAVLVLLGWELNFTESLVIILSVGLSIDFTIHFGIAYKQSQSQTRREKVTDALDLVGSAVTMAAVTTFASGVSVMGGHVLMYRQFGIFLMLVMVISWSYAIFFFLPMCVCIGPEKHFGDLKALFQICRDRRSQRRVPQGVTDRDNSEDNPPTPITPTGTDNKAFNSDDDNTKF